MKSNTTRVVTLIFCVVLLGVSVVTAQNPRVGGVAAPELLIPVGAADMAQGGSSLAITKPRSLAAILSTPSKLNDFTDRVKPTGFIVSFHRKYISL